MKIDPLNRIHEITERTKNQLHFVETTCKETMDCPRTIKLVTQLKCDLKALRWIDKILYDCGVNTAHNECEVKL